MKLGPQLHYPNSEALFARARQVIPQGIWGYERFPSTVDPGYYPHFARRGSGAELEDVDGNRYIDWICGHGAMIIGYGRKEVDSAAEAVRRDGMCLSLATEMTITFAERLTALVKGAAWAAFGKNGSDATWIALTVARAHTEHSKVICIDGAYHGSHGWCGWCNFGAGRPQADYAAVTTVPWGDAAALEAAFTCATEPYAAVIVTPFHHPVPGPAEMPAHGYLDKVTSITHHHGAVMILDDVRAGFRLDLHGSHVALGGKPDLICFSKAIANGHPLAAVTGVNALRIAANAVFLGGTFWNSPDAMAAGLATLEILAAEQIIPRIETLGRALAEGLEDAGRALGIPMRVTGPPQIPTVTIDGDNGSKMKSFARYLVANGVLVDPDHNWFVSAAHTEHHVSRTIEVARAALRQRDYSC